MWCGLSKVLSKVSSGFVEKGITAQHAQLLSNTKSQARASSIKLVYMAKGEDVLPPIVHIKTKSSTFNNLDLIFTSRDVIHLHLKVTRNTRRFDVFSDQKFKRWYGKGHCRLLFLCQIVEFGQLPRCSYNRAYTYSYFSIMHVYLSLRVFS